MSRPRRKAKPQAEAEAVGGTPLTAEAVPSHTAVLTLTECIIGTRRTVGEWFEIPTERVADLTAGGLVISQAQIDALWAAEGRILSPDGVASQYQPAQAGGLKVLQLTQYDPGSSVYRYHSAANTVAGVTSAFVRFGHSNPHCDLRQWDSVQDAQRVRALLATADVVHCHMDYRCLRDDLREGTRAGRTIARTYHGSIGGGRTVLVEPDDDARMGAVVFGARPYHLRWVPHWLPIPMPVKDYAALSAKHTRGKVFRIAHSPTNRGIKGSDVFESAVNHLREAEGLPIEAVLIQGRSHSSALAIKATCDATFDSFWLGMQGSGLEAAAMGQAVIAGTWDTDYERAGFADVPWTVANTGEELRDVLRRMVTDAGFYAAETARVHEYVKAVHDYPVVGAKYRDILLEATRGAARPR